MEDNINDSDINAINRKQAIDDYMNEFESDSRNYSPGFNALSLMYFGDEKDDRFDKFLPIVSYAFERHLKMNAKDYFAQASALELAVLALNEIEAKKYYSAARTCLPVEWMKVTTAGNLKKIYDKAIKTSDEQSLQWLKNILVGLDPGIFDGE